MARDFLSEQIQEQVRKTKQQASEPKSKVLEREWQSDEGRNERLREVAERIAPNDTTWVSSYAVHVYKSTLSELQDAILLTQVTSIFELPETVALEATKALALHVMRKYGHKPPAKRGENYNFKNDSPHIKVK